MKMKQERMKYERDACEVCERRRRIGLGQSVSVWSGPRAGKSRCGRLGVRHFPARNRERCSGGVKSRPGSHNGVSVGPTDAPRRNRNDQRWREDHLEQQQQSDSDHVGNWHDFEQQRHDRATWKRSRAASEYWDEYHDQQQYGCNDHCCERGRGAVRRSEHIDFLNQQRHDFRNGGKRRSGRGLEQHHRRSQFADESNARADPRHGRGCRATRREWDRDEYGNDFRHHGEHLGQRLQQRRHRHPVELRRLHHEHGLRRDQRAPRHHRRRRAFGARLLRHLSHEPGWRNDHRPQRLRHQYRRCPRRVHFHDRE